MRGFTLAEVLITLGIIGVVAALTLPSLIANYQKKQTVVKLKRFYTTMNQAIRLSEAENGPAEDWTYPAANNNDAQMLEFYNRYLANYLKSTKAEICNYRSFNMLCVYYTDGTLVAMRNAYGIDIDFFTNVRYFSQGDSLKNRFNFNLNKINTGVSKIQQYQIEPYTYGWDGTRAGLFSHSRYGCRKDSPTGNFCAKLIQYDGWQIKDDYPW
jgi:prepilin-type N-terminal cleavage/methylation domain-containing protein